MLEGLRETENLLGELNIGFVLLQCSPEMGGPGMELARYASSAGAGCVVTDYSPLRISQQWKREAAALLKAPFYEVDAHNIVPCLAASGKQEYAARTFRPKNQPAAWKSSCCRSHPLRQMPQAPELPPVNWTEVIGNLSV